MSAPAHDEISYLADDDEPAGIVDLGEARARANGGPPPIAEPEIPLEVYPGWELEQVQELLKGAGAGIHLLIGAGENDWKMTEADLERIGKPLTRIVNRWEPALKLSPVADPLLVAKGFAIYGWRSALEQKRAQRDQAEQGAGPGYIEGSAIAPEPRPAQAREPDPLDGTPYFQPGSEPQ